MKNALLLHGTNGNSGKNWFPWLKEELERRGYIVWVPDLPHADRPSITRYNKFIFARWKFDADSIIVGHSSGAVAVLGILEQVPINVRIKKAILVAGFTDDLGWKELKELFKRTFDWKKIKHRARKIILFHSDNDPYVPLWHGEKLQKFLGAHLIIMKGQAHFNTSTFPDHTKYRQFPELLEKVVE